MVINMNRMLTTLCPKWLYLLVPFSCALLLSAAPGKHKAKSFVISDTNRTGNEVAIKNTSTGSEQTVAVSPVFFTVHKQGESIKAELTKTDEGVKFSSIWPDDANARGNMEQINRMFLQKLQSRGKRSFLDTGERMPKFALWDQKGELIQSRNYRGRFVVMNFIFTRCPDPNMCPLSTTKMIRLQKMAKENNINDIQLVSISLDPEYDTPLVMREYLDAKGANQDNFDFLSGSTRVIDSLKKLIGVLTTKGDDGSLQHTMMTTVFDKNGKIFYRVPGSGWSPKDVMKRIEDKISSQKTR